MIDIPLNNVRVLDPTRRLESDFDGRTQINRNNVTRTPAGDPVGMTPLATTSLQHDFIFEEFGAHRGNPTQELFIVFVMFLSKFLPRPAKLVSRGLFIGFNILELGEARNTA